MKTERGYVGLHGIKIHKLQPCLGINIEAMEKASLHTQVQVEPYYEDRKGICWSPWNKDNLDMLGLR